MTIRTIMAAVALAGAISAPAQRAVESLILKNGDIYNGYIKQSDADNYIFHTESIIAKVSSDSIFDPMIDRKESPKEFSDAAYADFFRNNHGLFVRYISSDQNDKVKVLGLRQKNGLPRPVVRSNNYDATLYLLAGINEDRIVPRNDVKDIEYHYDKKAQVGLYDVIVTKNGKKYVGFKKRMNEDTGQIKFEDKDGIPETFDYDDIVAVGYQGIDEETDIAAQSPLIKTYFFESGQKLRGIATSIDYENNTITIVPVGSENAMPPMSTDDYTHFTAERNPFPATEPAPRMTFGNGQVYVNGRLVPEMAGESRRSFSKKLDDVTFTNVFPTDRRGNLAVTLMGNAGQVAIVRAPIQQGNLVVSEKSFDEAVPNTAFTPMGKQGESIYTFEALPNGEYIMLIRGLQKYYLFKVTD